MKCEYKIIEISEVYLTMSSDSQLKK